MLNLETKIEKLKSLKNISKLFVPIGHFYSPFVDTSEASIQLNRVIDLPKEKIKGINLDLENMKSFFETLKPHMQTMPFADTKNTQHRYHYKNDFFPEGDASVYYGIMAHYQPKKTIEIGSGYSSALALDTREHLNLETELTFIEPYPVVLNSLLSEDSKKSVRILQEKVQNVPLSEFEKLDANDILFVDSSHILKTGSDVCFEIFDILPSLKSGVLVHFHDIFYPFEYPSHWIMEDKRQWNELYALRAFLMYNNQFDVVFFNDYFDRMAEEAKDTSTPFHKHCGAGIWLVKK